jgi:DNA-binding winged helix-turn-helix (wHTH) protein/TolB-like protein
MEGSTRLPQLVRFAEYQLDTRAGELRKGDSALRLQKQSLRVLLLLLERPGEMVSREELRTTLWPDHTFVDFEDGLNHVVRRLREALAESAEKPRFIQTLPGRGYRFIAPVEAAVAARTPPLQWRWGLRLGIVALALVGVVAGVIGYWHTRSPRVPGARKALAVVSIENMTEDRSLEWLDNGVAELLTTDLAQAKTLDVISTERVRELINRRTKGEGRLPAGETQAVAKEAHADMFLSGALLKVGSRLRLDLRAQDTATGVLLFADKVEGEDAQAVFGMVDQATAGILARLEPSEAAAEPNAAASLTANLEALRAYEEGVSYWSRLLVEEALRAFRRAIELDPQFAMAQYQAAGALFISDLPAARQAIARAAQLADRLPLPRLQKVLIQTERLREDGRLQEAEQVAETAVRDFPRETQPRWELADIRSLGWRYTEAMPVYEEIIRLDDRQAWAYNMLAMHTGSRAISLAP